MNVVYELPQAPAADKWILPSIDAGVGNESDVATPLRFRVAVIYLTLNPRFQVLYWIPYGAASLRQCARWAEDEGER